MRELLRRLLLVLMALSVAACTTTKVVARGPEASVAALKDSPALGDPRDSVILVTRDGTRHLIRLQSVSSESVSGTTLDRRPIVIATSDIERVETDEIDTRTVVTVVVVVLVVVVAAAVSASHSLAKSLTASPR